MIKLGLKRFESVNLIGFNSFEFVCAFTGSIVAGGISTGIYTTNLPNACLDNAIRSNCTFVVVDGFKQLEKYIEIQDEFCPKGVIMYYFIFIK